LVRAPEGAHQHARRHAGELRGPLERGPQPLAPEARRRVEALALRLGERRLRR
jgi:hypothetical protein